MFYPYAYILYSRKCGMANDYMYIVAVVALVALAGMYGGSSAAVSYGSYRTNLPIGADPAHYEQGYEYGQDCDAVDADSFAESRRCCYDACADYCMDKAVTTGTGHTINDCGGVCVSACEVYREEAQKTGGRTRGLSGNPTELF